MILFIILGVLAIVSAILTVTVKNPVKSAVSLVAHFFILAGIYLSINAQFLAVAQVLVYAGAIMVLIVFVIMLLNLTNEKNEHKNFVKPIIIAIFPAALLFLLTAVIINSPLKSKELPEQVANSGSAQSIGLILYGEYQWAVIGIGMLLTIAIVGAVLIAKREKQKL